VVLFIYVYCLSDDHLFYIVASAGEPDNKSRIIIVVVKIVLQSRHNNILVGSSVWFCFCHPVRSFQYIVSRE